MGKTIKVIDLLNKIANGTQPKIIIFDTEKYIWEKERKEYRRYPYENNLYYSLWSDYDLIKCLNEEVEVIEAPQGVKFEFSPDGISIFGPVAQEEKLNEEDFLKIINHFGLENQREYLGKEYQELQDELYKYVVCGDECEMLTEIADVFVLCLQFLFEYGYELKDLKEEINSKVKRTLERMENGFYD